MINSLQITGNFDGGNPKDPNSIIQTGRNSFTIIPYSEDNDPNYKFRLDIIAKNVSDELNPLNLTIDWQEPKFNHLRNYVYSKSEKDTDWQFNSLSINDTTSFGTIQLNPGDTYIAMHPKYSYSDYLQFIEQIEETDHIRKIKIGETAEKRDMWMVEINSNGNRSKKKIMVVARIHPYETAGSYCIEGIINNFLSHYSLLTTHLPPFTIYLIPMTNPDGVYNGLCKKSASDGIDLSKQLSNKDTTSRLLKAAIDKIQPHIYCEFHNWMLHEYDGIYFLNWFQAKHFVRKLHLNKLFNKEWKIHLRKKLFSIPQHGFKKYCHEKFDSICLCLEYPWRNRNIEDMKKIGFDSLMALTKL